MKTTNWIDAQENQLANLLATETQKQLQKNELAKLSGKLLYQDDETATYFVLAQVEKVKTKKAKSKQQAAKTPLVSWETILLVATWITFLGFVCLVN